MIKSVEKLFHFQCKNCSKWWSIGDFHTIYQSNIYCPFCKEGFYVTSDYLKENNDVSKH